MPGLVELKKRLHEDENFGERFIGIKNMDQAVSLAQKLGFNVSREDVESDSELSEDMLEAVAGGKNKTENNTYYDIDVSGYDLVIDKKTGDIIKSNKRDINI